MLSYKIPFYNFVSKKKKPNSKIFSYNIFVYFVDF